MYANSDTGTVQREAMQAGHLAHKSVHVARRVDCILATQRSLTQMTRSAGKPACQGTRHIGPSETEDAA